MDFTSIDLPASPNNYLVCSTDICTGAEADEASPVYDAEPDTVVEEVRAYLNALPRTDILDEGAPGQALHAVVSSLVFRFKDDVYVLVLSNGQDRSHVAVYSQSRVGYWDLGVNKRRVRALLAHLDAKLGGS